MHALGLGVVLLVGAWWRLRLIGEDLFGDELATWWDVTSPQSIAGVIRLVSTDAEITPPLFFVLARIASWFGHSAEMMRLPSLIAGLLLIPVVYVWGRDIASRSVGLLAATIVAVAPFQLYYSTEARAYAVMMLLVALSTVSLWRAVHTQRILWWVGYALCVAGAMYSHYTAIFTLIVLAVWALLACPAARVKVLAANGGAALLFAPWVPSVLRDQNSWTTDILSALTPLDIDSLVRYWTHWSIGYPYAANPPGTIPGWPAVGALAVGLGVGAYSLIRQVRFDLRSPVALTVMLALANPVLALLVSLVGSNVYGPRNLAASWPALAVTLALVALAPRGRARALAVGGVVVCFVTGGALTALRDRGRPRVSEVLRVVDSEAGPRDVLVDGTAVLSPGPASVADTIDHVPIFTVRVGAPEVRDRPFGLGDVRPSPMEVLQRLARDLPAGGRVFWVTPVFKVNSEWLRRAGANVPRQGLAGLFTQSGWRIERRYDSQGGLLKIRLFVLSRARQSS